MPGGETSGSARRSAWMEAASEWGPLQRYGLAVALVAATTAVRFALHPYLGTRSIYTFFFLAVTASALFGGTGPGIASIVLSAVLALYLFIPPDFAFKLHSAADWIGLVVYGATGLVIVALAARERRARARSRASEARYRELVETSRDLVWAFDLEGRVTFVNGQASRTILGFEAEELIGKPWTEFVPPDERTRLQSAFAAVLAGETMLHVPVVAATKSGEPRYLVVNAVARRNAAGNVVGVTGTSTDLTASRRQEEDLRLFRVMMERSADGIMIVDATRRVILDINETFCRWLDYPAEELIGGTTERIILPHPTLTWEERGADAYRLATQQSAADPQHVMEVAYRRRDGTPLEREVGYRYLRVKDRDVVVVVARDVSERKRLEQQLLHSQKMEGIGRLAGGIAHDFNNVLTVISGYTELALAALPPGSPIVEDLGEVRRAAARASSLTRQLLAFARKQIIQPRLVSLSELVRDVEGMLRRLIGEDIDLSVRAADELWTVNVDPGQFEQVLLNLTVNARDAMPTGGALTIETANVVLGDEYAREHPDVIPGEYVRVSVTDTGIGMDADVRQRAFEPFFTTKEQGRGTGLGLATTHGIVEQSGGHIWLYSEPGRGTSFKLYFPRSSRGAPAQPRTDATVVRSGTETLMVAEDEDIVRRFAASALARLGYRVLPVASGAEALATAESFAGPIHLLITDVVMPHMNGRELAARLKAQRPDVRVLYASGYTDDTIVHHGVLDPGVWFLQKPYSSAELGAKVREVLDAAE